MVSVTKEGAQAESEVNAVFKTFLRLFLEGLGPFDQILNPPVVWWFIFSFLFAPQQPQFPAGREVLSDVQVAEGNVTFLWFLIDT